MKGLQMLNGWCLLIAAGLLVMQQIDMTAGYSMEETCKYINGGWIADPTDCQSYGYCENLVLKGKQKCPDGSYYDPDTGVCKYQKNCRLNAGTMCQGVADYTVFPHPDNCTKYVYCENGVDRIGSCPINQIYDSRITQCVYPNPGVVCAAKSICRLVQNNVFAADPLNCGNYIPCYQGTGQSNQCPPQKSGAANYFSQQTNQCQPTKFCVDNGSSNTNSGNQQPTTPDGSQCTAGKTYISDGVSCYGYFKCNAVGEVGDYLVCPEKLHFNPDTEQCVTPYTYPCPYDRCGNMGAQFMGAIVSKNCTTYLTCKNNAYINAAIDPTFKGAACNKDYYFDEYLQQCVPKNPATNNPNYKLCPNV